ncbi:MAG TPA: LPS assembly protein LptD [Syntrophorhabdales bacterium]|nr:LPS assembly protein LptD [Syntrophorhabdales bacterium]
MNTNWYKIIWVLILFSLPLSSEAKGLTKRAANGPVDILADSLEYKKNEDVYIAKGHVEIKEGTATLNADYVEYHEDSGDVLAEGNVVLQDSEGTVRTQRMTLNLVTKEGTIEKGDIYVKQGNFYIMGDEIKKTGEATYLIQRGKFTTCGWDRPAWTFTAKDINLNAQGYATASNAKFSILNQPIFFMPWGVFPVKTERQSGLLLPELVKSSRDGYRLTESYYWAISRDTDATFGLQWIQDRGLRPEVEYRYFTSPGLKGAWSASIIDDAKYGHTRYNIVGEHTQAINDSLTIKSKIYQVSDQDYLKDFGLTTLQRSENSVKSTLFAEQASPKSLLTAETTYFRTLTQKDNDQTMQHLPFVSFFTEYMPVLKDKLYTNVSSDIANFSRDQGTTYSRFTAQPAMRVPFHIEGFNFLAGTTFIERLYSINQKTLPDAPIDNDQKKSDNFQTVMIEGDANFLAYRNWKTELFGLGDVQSVIKPRVSYTLIPATNTADLPNIDPSDQIVKTDTVTYSFSHYLNAISKDSSREISLLEIEQTYGLSGNLGASPLYVIGNGDNQALGRRFSDIHTKLTLYPGKSLLVAQESYIDPYSGGAKILRNTLGIVQPKFSTTISHTYQAGDINQVLWLSNATYKDFDGRISILYDIRESGWISTLYAITYHPKCWSITLTLIQERRPPDTSIHLSFNLSGITGNAQPAVLSTPPAGLTPPAPAPVRGTYGLQERVF